MTAQQGTSVTITLSGTDADNGDTLGFEIVSLPDGGELSELGSTITTVSHVLTGGAVTYRSNSSFIGSDQFTFRANDGIAESGLAYITITVPATVNSVIDAVDSNPGEGICGDGDGNCTLRAAIMEANALAGAQTIIVPAGTYALSISRFGEDEAATGDLDITDELTIIGAGADSTIIDRQHCQRQLRR